MNYDASTKTLTVTRNELIDAHTSLRMHWGLCDDNFLREAFSDGRIGFSAMPNSALKVATDEQLNDLAGHGVFPEALPWDQGDEISVVVTGKPSAQEMVQIFDFALLVNVEKVVALIDAAAVGNTDIADLGRAARDLRTQIVELTS